MEIEWLVEYNMRNIFLEKSYAKFGAETSQTIFIQVFAKFDISLGQ